MQLVPATSWRRLTPWGAGATATTSRKQGGGGGAFGGGTHAQTFFTSFPAFENGNLKPISAARNPWRLLLSNTFAFGSTLSSFRPFQPFHAFKPSKLSTRLHGFKPFDERTASRPLRGGARGSARRGARGRGDVAGGDRMPRRGALHKCVVLLLVCTSVLFYYLCALVCCFTTRTKVVCYQM
jgi:hypothetical protein